MGGRYRCNQSRWSWRSLKSTGRSRFLGTTMRRYDRQACGKNSPLADGAVHFSVSPSWGGAGRFGAEMALLDCLSVGPVDSSACVQSRTRRRYWTNVRRRLGRWSAKCTTDAKPTRGASRAGPTQFVRVHWATGLQNAFRRCPSPKPLVLWTSRTWQDRVTTWCLMSVLGTANVDPARLWIAEPYRSDYGVMEGLACYPIRDLQHALERAVVMEQALLREGQALWQKFSSPSPVALDTALRKGSRWFPGLPDAARHYRTWFPRWHAGRKSVRLSALDEFLLETFDETEWRTPLSVFKRDRFFRDMMRVVSDVACVDRLLQWLEYEYSDPVLEFQRVKGLNQFTSLSFRRTPFGHRLLDAGLPSIDAAPPVFIGGCKVYSGDAPYVCVQERTRERIAPL